MIDYIDSLGETKDFTALETYNCYWKVFIAPQDLHKTSFVCHLGMHQYTRIPFGLKNVPATYQHALYMVLTKFKWKNCLVYMDDVIIY